MSAVQTMAGFFLDNPCMYMCICACMCICLYILLIVASNGFA